MPVPQSLALPRFRSPLTEPVVRLSRNGLQWDHAARSRVDPTRTGMARRRMPPASRELHAPVCSPLAEPPEAALFHRSASVRVVTSFYVREVAESRNPDRIREPLFPCRRRRKPPQRPATDASPPSAGRAPTGRTVFLLGLSSRVRAWSARRSNSCTPSTEAWVQTRIAKGQERRNVYWPLKGKQHSNDHSHPNYSRRHRCWQVRTRRLSRTGRPSPPLRQHQARPPRSAQLAGPARRHPRRLRTHRALPPRAAPVPVRLRSRNRRGQPAALPALRRSHRQARQERPRRRLHAGTLRPPLRLGRHPAQSPPSCTVSTT